MYSSRGSGDPHFSSDRQIKVRHLPCWKGEHLVHDLHYQDMEKTMCSVMHVQKETLMFSSSFAREDADPLVNFSAGGDDTSSVVVLVIGSG